MIIRMDFITPYCNRNLQGLPKHLNEHPRVSEQNLLLQNMVWRTKEASRPPGDPTLEGPRIPPHQDFSARSRPHQTPHHRVEGGGFPPTRPHTTARDGSRGGWTQGGGFPDNFGGVGGKRSVATNTHIILPLVSQEDRITVSNSNGQTQINTLPHMVWGLPGSQHSCGAPARLSEPRCHDAGPMLSRLVAQP